MSQIIQPYDLVNRPRSLSPDQLRAVVTEAVNELISRESSPPWRLPANIRTDLPFNSGFAQITDDIVQYYRQGDGGYDLAKRLDDEAQWRIDSGLVDDLDGVIAQIKDAVMAAEFCWAVRQDVNIAPLIGKIVRVSLVGRVMAVDPQTLRVAFDADIASNNRVISLPAEAVMIVEPEPAT